MFNLLHLNNVHLRNLLTHTAINLLQMLNYVKWFQYFVVDQSFNNIYIMCEKFRTTAWIISKIQLILFERVNIESHNNWNFDSNLRLSEVILI